MSWEIQTIADRAAGATSMAEVGAYLVLGVVLGLAIVSLMGLILNYSERKICAHIQCRLGPMRVGFHGLLQPIADGVKLLFKEDISPRNADRLVYIMAPFISLLATFLIVVTVPFSPLVQIADLNIGVVYVAAVSGFGVLGVLLAGWSSNNKWSMMGAMRAGAQMVSYELSAVLALLTVVLLSQSLKLSEVVLSQEQGWWIFRAPVVGLVACVIFFVASCAEINRTPFDLAEGESELTAGFHTEYSGLRFALFFLAEFVNMFLVSAMLVTFFLGGWMPFHLGGLTGFNEVMDLLPPGIWFLGKVTVVVLLFMWVRWTFPRLRIDQVMNLEWKILLPIGFANLFLTSIVVLLDLYLF